MRAGADPERLAGASARTIRVGLIGRAIQLSRTPGMHEAEGRALGLAYDYALFDMDERPDDTLADVVARAEADGYAGLNVTHPYKREALAIVSDLSDAARRIGAINTIVFRDGRRYGHNTDFWGFAEGFRQGLPDAPRDTVLLLGAGGAGGAVAHALYDLGVGRLLITDTRDGAAQTLAAEVNAVEGRQAAEWVADVAEAAARADGIVNATPVGMTAMPGTPLDPALLMPRHWVADILYFPLETELLSAARATGCATLSGEGMSVYQAVRAFELFSGIRPDAARMRQAFHAQGEA